MANFTRKKKIGGESNIFSKYDPEEVRRKLDNYLAAAYALKQSSEELLEGVKIKNDIRNSSSTSVIENNNSEEFKKATQKFSELITSLKTNIR